MNITMNKILCKIGIHRGLVVKLKLVEKPDCTLYRYYVYCALCDGYLSLPATLTCVK